MKFGMIGLLVLVFSFSVWAEVPECRNVGTRSEGWYLHGKLLTFDNCAHENTSCQKMDKSSVGCESCQTLCNVTCHEVCTTDCRIVNGEQVCESSCNTICPEVCNVTCSNICD